MATALIAAALAAATVPASSVTSAGLPDASPAIWVVNDEDTVIYLFGTFHALDGRSDWFNDEVVTAFVASDELILETIVPDAAPKPPSATSGHRSIPGLSLAPSASFLAATRLAIDAGKANGMNVGKGADAVLRQVAEATGKRVDGLESFEEQLAMLARIPGTSPSAQPSNRAAAGMASLMGQLQSAWNSGEQGIFVAMLDQMRRTSPHSYDAMFTKRNEIWAGWIADRLDRPGTVFVAVGAGHLAGPDCVQAKLAHRGVKSARIN